MKKVAILMLMLAVVGVASCEKEQMPAERESPVKNTENPDPGKSAAMAELIGLWTMTQDASQGELEYYYDYAWRFYEDGTGYLTIDGYAEAGKVNSYTRAPFSYDIRNNLLYVTYVNNKEAIEWHYELEGVTLTMYSEMDELGNTYIFTKSEDASPKFIGDWHYTEQLGDGRRVDRHIVFDTPVDGHLYDIVYNNESGSDSETRHGAMFKYTFDDETLTINKLECGPYGSSGTTTYYYRLESTHLGLKTAQDGPEKIYVNFKKEHNL